jgi:lipoprotein NlpI
MRTQAMADPWQLIKNKQYEAAVSEYSRLIELHPTRNPNRYNRGTAYLLMKNFNAALEDFNWIIQDSDPRYATTGEFTFAGICCWYLGRPVDALAHWRKGVDAPYRDAAGGVETPALLLYAAERLRDDLLRKESIAMLKELWRKHSAAQKRKKPHLSHDDLVHPGLVAWPGAIVPFLLNHLDESSFIQKSEESSSDTLRTRHRCAADFYRGVRALRLGDRLGFQSRMKDCVESHYGELEHEFYLARWEVERGFPEHVPSIM